MQLKRLDLFFSSVFLRSFSVVLFQVIFPLIDVRVIQYNQTMTVTNQTPTQTNVHYGQPFYHFSICHSCLPLCCLCHLRGWVRTFLRHYPLLVKSFVYGFKYSGFLFVAGLVDGILVFGIRGNVGDCSRKQRPRLFFLVASTITSSVNAGAGYCFSGWHHLW